MGDTPAHVLLGVSLKLYLGIAQSAGWARGLAGIARSAPAVRDGRVRLFALPSLPALPAVKAELAGSGVGVGAQDLHWADRGAFTGAVSGADLADAGCSYAEVGHAERRRVFGESDATVNAKFAAALRNGLTPVLCVGEAHRSEPEAAAAECIRQLESALGADPAVLAGAEVIVAYEPVWAIGASEPATPAHVRAVSTALRTRLGDFSQLRSAAIIYGGSAQRGTLGALAGTVDGLFLGRFAHDPRELAAIVDEAAGIC